MKAVISLDGILSFIHSLSLSASNKQWLGESCWKKPGRRKPPRRNKAMPTTSKACAAHGKTTRARRKK